jgi:CheY-like chemotaxis protein
VALPPSGTALVVEADENRATAMARALRDAGWKAHTDATGAGALRRAAGVDLVVVGTELRDMHGLDFLQRLRATPAGVDLPVVLLGSEPRQARMVGADGSSPPTGPALLAEAARVLAEPRRVVVLLIEDDPEVRFALRRSLNLHRYGCLEAQNGEQGLTLLDQRVPDVVVTDLHLPHLDGIEVLERIRQNPALSHLPAIVITAFADAATRQRARSLDARVLDKPFEPSDLLQRLGDLLPKRSG